MLVTSPKVVCSVMEPDVASTLQQVRNAPAACEWIEVRADYLDAAGVAEVVARSSRPLILTVRGLAEGGHFSGDEDERVACLRVALDAGVLAVDVEWKSPAEALIAEYDRDRIILSHHGVACRLEVLRELHREMAQKHSGLLKIVPSADRASDLTAVRGLLRELRGESSSRSTRVACFALGRAGALSRICAPAWGSWATYGAVRCDRPTASGQFTASDLLDVYDVLRVGDETRWYALVGSHVFSSPSPAMHAAGYAALGLDARYVPIESDDLEDVRAVMASGIPEVKAGLSGLAVTMPFKQAAAARCSAGDATTGRSGAVNTVLVEGDDWTGFNTDGPAALRLIDQQVSITGASVAIVGAGGTARAIAAEAVEAGASVTIFNRSRHAGEEAASRVGARFAAIDDLPRARWDVLVNATPLGKCGETVLPAAALTGRMVLDAVYGPAATPLTVDARERGLAVVDGFNLLVEQAVLQFNRMTGQTPTRQTLYAAGRSWLSRQA